MLRLAAQPRSCGLAERRRRSPDPQVNGASLHCFSDVVGVPAAIECSSGLLSRRRDSHTTRRERFHHGSSLIDRLLCRCGPPHAPELNGDDCMAADPEQSRRPPNSPRSLSRQATSFYVTVIDRSNTSNTITHPVPICHDLSTFGFPCTPSITVMPGMYIRNTCGNSVSGTDSGNAQKKDACPRAERGSTRLAARRANSSRPGCGARRPCRCAPR